MEKNDKKKILTLGIICLVLLGLIGGLSLVSKTQVLKQRATGTVNLSLDPASGNKNKGDSFTVAVKMVSSEAKTTSSGQVNIQFDPNIFTISNIACGEALPNAGFSAVEQNKINILCSKQDGFTFQAGVPITFATFQVQVKNDATATSGALTFTYSMVSEKGTYQDLAGQVTGATYTVGGGQQQTVCTDISYTLSQTDDASIHDNFAAGKNVKVDITRPAASKCPSGNWDNVKLKYDGTDVQLSLSGGFGYSKVLENVTAGTHTLQLTVNNGACSCNSQSFTVSGGAEPTFVPFGGACETTSQCESGDASTNGNCSYSICRNKVCVRHFCDLDNCMDTFTYNTETENHTCKNGSSYNRPAGSKLCCPNNETNCDTYCASSTVTPGATTVTLRGTVTIHGAIQSDKSLEIESCKVINNNGNPNYFACSQGKYALVRTESTNNGTTTTANYEITGVPLENNGIVFWNRFCSSNKWDQCNDFLGEYTIEADPCTLVGNATNPSTNRGSACKLSPTAGQTITTNYDVILPGFNGTIPSITETPEPTVEPTVEPTQPPGEQPTVEPTVEPTQPPVTEETPVLDFKVKFQGIDSKRADRLVKVSIKKTGFEKVYLNVPVTADDNGIYSGSVALVDTPVGSNYKIFIKGPQQLTRVFGVNNQDTRYIATVGQIALAAGTNNFNFSKLELETGDLPNPNENGAQDGVINVVDLGLIKSRFDSTAQADLAVADVNLDDAVNHIDYQIVVRNLMEKPGEEEE